MHTFGHTEQSTIYGLGLILVLVPYLLIVLMYPVNTSIRTLARSDAHAHCQSQRDGKVKGHGHVAVEVRCAAVQ